MVILFDQALYAIIHKQKENKTHLQDIVCSFLGKLPAWISSIYFKQATRRFFFIFLHIDEESLSNIGE
jgi:hypothetical protein